MNYKFILITIVLFISGCINTLNEPVNTVIDNNENKIYAKIENSNNKLGKYEYWILSKSSNWKLISNKDFLINDNIVFISKDVLEKQ